MRAMRRRSLTALSTATLTVALVVGGSIPPLTWAGGGRVRAAPARTMATQGLAGSPKPDWRGADLGNTGRLPTYGPVVTPTQTFNVQPLRFGVTGGLELAPDGSVIFTADRGVLFAYHPDGTLKWALPTPFVTDSIGPIGSDLTASGSNPVVAADGTIYLGTDTGNLYQVDGATGVAQSIFSSATGKGIVQTPKIAPDGSLYVGTADGVFYHLTPPALDSGGAATQLYAFAAQGSTQTSGPAAGVTSGAPFLFYGEAALDGAGNAYAASTDTNPTTSTPTLGTVYQIKPDGTLGWKAPLQGAVAGAVLLAPNPAAPGQTLVVVADRSPEVAAFDAATGARVWDFVPSLEADPFTASPALSADGATVYVPNTGNSLFGLRLASGALVPGFGSGGIVTVPGGSSSSPIVDAAGDIFLENTAGVLSAYTPAGTQLWSVPAGSAPGTSGSGGARFMSPAIGADGTLYVGGNKATVRGFLGTLPPTNTPAPIGTPTQTGVSSTPTNLPATSTAAPTGTPTQAVLSPTPGSSVTPTGAGGGVWPKFRYDLHNSGAVTVTLELTNPGALFSHRFSTGLISAALRASPAVGADGTIYQVDDLGRLNAVASDGSVRWTSAAVLGTFNVSTGALFDLGSSPAIGPGGSIYVGSESGGIYRFNPADGGNNQVFASGKYQGGSVVVGPDGSLYAGSLDGTIYAVRADGTQRYAFVAPCTPPYSPVVQSTPALDKNGVLYIGYGCTGGANLRGGVVAVSPTGTQLWKYTYSNPQQPGITGGEIASAVILAPDEGTVYAVDFSQAGVYAINARDGAQRWATSLGGSVYGGGALSPDGSLLYLQVGDGTGFVGGLYAFRTADGSNAATQAEAGTGYASPAVDGSGQVIAAYGNGHVVGYSPGLGSVVFDRVAAGEGQAIFGGPVIGTGGAFYITNNKGYLIALKANVFQATPTPVPTTEPPPTGFPPTLTPQPTIGLSTPTPTAVPASVTVQVYPRGLVETAPHPEPCRLADSLGMLRKGCELVFSASAPDASLVYTVRYAHGLVQVFTTRADTQGRSLRVFNLAYVPPAGTPPWSPLALVRVTVAATSRFGKALGSASVDFRVVRPRT